MEEPWQSLYFNVDQKSKMAAISGEILKDLRNHKHDYTQIVHKWSFDWLIVA
jgi:hypothetical protein